jgi:hypothetical protein
VARNNADWYRLLNLCSVTDTLIGDEDGIYHPGLFNDHLLLGLKGTMAEAELHVIHARLEGGIRNKAARGELRRGLPIGFIWGENDGEVIFHPDQAVTQAIASLLERFDEAGSVRQVWLWFRSQRFSFPSQSLPSSDIQWITPTYTAIHQVLINPVYAGAYTYGKMQQERYVDQTGRLNKRTCHLPRSKWAVLIHDHHKGFIDWETYEMNQSRIAKNTRPLPHQDAGTIREGVALLQGIAKCGRGGRNLRVYYQGKHSTPGYYCAANNISNGRGMYCLRFGGALIDRAVAHAFLDTIAVEPTDSKAHLTVRWRGGTISELDLSLKGRRVRPVRTDEETIYLVRRLAVHYPDAVIAGILNRQGRRTAHGDRFTVNKVGNLRRYWKIPRFEPGSNPAEGELVTVIKAAKILGVAPSTLHRWLADGFIAGEQITPGAPWRIRISQEIRDRFVEEAPEGHVPILDAIRLLGVSRQTVLQRVKRGELSAVHVRCGRRKGLYIHGIRYPTKPF